jgi:tRNA threonylcarbamoyladenosine biosynthesis protein TsaB
MEPRFLIIETSGRVGQIALAEGEVLRGGRQLDEARRHARDLAPAVAALLNEQGWKPADVQAVIVSLGPGSYTGLRVGLISAQTFAYATGCAVLGVPTFAAIARQADPAAAQVAVLADAQQGKVYAQLFAGSGMERLPTSPVRIQPFDTFLAECPDDLWLTGPAMELHAKDLGKMRHIVAAEAWHPRIASVLALGLARWQRGERDDLWKLEPEYGRPSAAEEKWDARKPS